MTKYYLLLFAFMVVIAACSLPANTYKPAGNFDVNRLSKAPDYTKLQYWAAHPDKRDNADSLPASHLKDVQANSEVDVFFVYPTIYTGNKKTQKKWNADVDDIALNKEIDNSTILHQSSVFNGTGKVYSPRYRQAHINVYYEKKRLADAAQAFDIAYYDVKTAFEYYLKNYNNGRPIVLAAHSQGTNHTERLLKEYFDGKALQKQLIAAYLVGMPIVKDSFKTIPPCITPEQTGCFCSWNAYSKNHYPKKWEFDLKYATATNPINWTIEGTYASREENKGGVMRDFTIKENLSDAKVKDGMVWIGKPNVTGAFFLRTKRWHYAEYNLFYMNIRENAQLRAKTFLNSL